MVMDFEDFKKIISVNLGINLSLIDRESSFRDHFRIDSLSLLNFLLRVEKKYNIRIDNEKIINMDTVGTAYSVIRELLAESGEEM